MARMIPECVAPTTKSNAEREFFAECKKQLGHEYVVFHSLYYYQQVPGNALRMREGDFLIFDQIRGVLYAVEVKGGSIRYDGNAGGWYQNNLKLDKTPYDQASDFMNEVVKFIRPELEAEDRRLVMPNYVSGVSFPDVSGVTKKLLDMEPRVTITGLALRDLPGALQAMYETIEPRQRLKYFTEDNAASVRRILMPTFEFGAAIADRMASRERVFLRLTREQSQLIDMMAMNKRAVIEGGAGTGKTVMAVRRAEQLAAAGASVLLLAYNEPLGERLAEQVCSLAPKVVAGHYHGVVIRLLSEVGVSPDIPARGAAGSSQFWRELLPDLLGKHLAEHPRQYDAIIVDEGQDFFPAYWLTLEAMLKPDGHFYIFSDPTQNLFQAPREYPIKPPAPHFLLFYNCRNTKAIINAVKTKTGVIMTPLAETPDGEPVREYHLPQEAARRAKLGAILAELLAGGVKTQQIVILGAHSFNHCWLDADPKLGEVTVVNEAAPGEGSVPYFTFMKFKGCEADVVILLDVSRHDARWKNPLMLYAAMSRAKQLLVMLYSD